MGTRGRAFPGTPGLSTAACPGHLDRGCGRPRTGVWEARLPSSGQMSSAPLWPGMGRAGGRLFWGYCPPNPHRPPTPRIHSFARGHTHFSGEKGTSSREARRHKPFPSGTCDLPEIIEAPPPPQSTSALSAAPPPPAPPQTSPDHQPPSDGGPAGTGPGPRFPSVGAPPTPGHCSLWGETLSGHGSPAP